LKNNCDFAVTSSIPDQILSSQCCVTSVTLDKVAVLT